MNATCADECLSLPNLTAKKKNSFKSSLYFTWWKTFWLLSVPSFIILNATFLVQDVSVSSPVGSLQFQNTASGIQLELPSKYLRVIDHKLQEKICLSRPLSQMDWWTLIISSTSLMPSEFSYTKTDRKLLVPVAIRELLPFIW